MNLLRIPLIFKRRRSTEADGVTEIIRGKTGHYSVQIHHAQRMQGLFVKKNIVQLGIIMRHSQRQFASGQLRGQFICTLCALKIQINQFFRSGASSADILSNGFSEGFKPCRRIVKMRNGLIKCFCRKIRQIALKTAECVTGFGEQIRRVRKVLADSMINKTGHAPRRAILSDRIGFTGFQRNDAQGFPVRVSSA